MTSFDRAWDIAKEDDPDYSKFGEKFARKIMDMKEGAKGLPEGTKFSDLTPSTGSGKVRSFDRGDIHTEESRRKLGDMISYLNVDGPKSPRYTDAQGRSTSMAYHRMIDRLREEHSLEDRQKMVERLKREAALQQPDTRPLMPEELSPGQQSFIDRTRRALAMPPKELPDETEELSD